MPMVPRTVYLETTIPSYLAARRSRDLVIAGRQELTQDWWERRRKAFHCFVSQVVIDEAEMGDRAVASRRLKYINEIPLLEVTDKAVRLAQELVASGPIPEKASRDALHIAVCAVHNISFLMTWNCTHLANAEIARDVDRVILRTGLLPVRICTPEELMGDLS